MNKFKLFAEALTTGRLKDIDLPTRNLDSRRLTIDEIKNLIKEEFKDAKAVCDVKTKEKHWSTDTDLEKHIDWIKALDLTEVFDAKKDE